MSLDKRAGATLGMGSPPPCGAGAPLPLEEAWAEFLGRWRWDWFVTLTFRLWKTDRHGNKVPKKPVHGEAADKLYRVWISKLNRHLWGPRWHVKGSGLRWCRASEPHRSGALHYHALLGGEALEGARRLSWMDEWDELAGYSRIEPPDREAAVRAYCAKYVTKAGQLDLGGDLLSLETPWLHPAAAPCGRGRSRRRSRRGARRRRREAAEDSPEAS